MPAFNDFRVWSYLIVGINSLIKAGIKIIVQPGGSIRDQEVINAANKAKIKMLFTGLRHFNH